MALRGFFVAVHYGIALSFAYWHYSICNLTIQYVNLIESGYVLAFLVFSCYTITRYKTRKNQGLTKGCADSRRKEDDRKDIHRISFLSATARVFVTFHT